MGKENKTKLVPKQNWGLNGHDDYGNYTLEYSPQVYWDWGGTAPNYNVENFYREQFLDKPDTNWLQNMLESDKIWQIYDKGTLPEIQVNRNENIDKINKMQEVAYMSKEWADYIKNVFDSYSKEQQDRFMQVISDQKGMIINGNDPRAFMKFDVAKRSLPKTFKQFLFNQDPDTVVSDAYYVIPGTPGKYAPYGGGTYPLLSEVAHSFQNKYGNNKISAERAADSNYSPDVDPEYGGKRYRHPNRGEGETHSDFEPLINSWIYSGTIPNAPTKPMWRYNAYEGWATFPEENATYITPKNGLQEVLDSARSYNQYRVQHKLNYDGTKLEKINSKTSEQ